MLQSTRVTVGQADRQKDRISTINTVILRRAVKAKNTRYVYRLVYVTLHFVHNIVSKNTPGKIEQTLNCYLAQNITRLLYKQHYVSNNILNSNVQVWNCLRNVGYVEKNMSTTLFYNALFTPPTRLTVFSCLVLWYEQNWRQDSRLFSPHFETGQNHSCSARFWRK